MGRQTQTYNQTLKRSFRPPPATSVPSPPPSPPSLLSVEIPTSVSDVQGFLDIKMKDILKHISEKVSLEKKLFESEPDELKFIKLIRKINDLIDQISIKGLHKHHVFEWIFADNTNIIYYHIYIHYKKDMITFKISEHLSIIEIKEKYKLYKQKHYNNYGDKKLIKFIKDVNDLDSSEWQTIIIDDKIYNSFHSGSTTTFSGYLSVIQIEIDSSSTSYTPYTNIYGYSALEFYGGFTGGLTFTCDTVATYGILAVGGGGDASNAADTANAGYTITGGGGGGGIFYNTDLQFNTSSTIEIVPGQWYNLSVGNNAQPTVFGANGLTCYQGQSGGPTYSDNISDPVSGGKVVSVPSYNTTQPSTPAYGNVWYYTDNQPYGKWIFNGGDGGDSGTPSGSADDNNAHPGSNSGLISVTLPYFSSSSQKYYLGGGGGGADKYLYYSNGGNGTGGAISYTSAAYPNNTQNDYNLAYGGSYGGGGGNHDNVPKIGGPGIFCIWWKG
jgi:hypothetical protein